MELVNPLLPVDVRVRSLDVFMHLPAHQRAPRRYLKRYPNFSSQHDVETSSGREFSMHNIDAN